MGEGVKMQFFPFVLFDYLSALKKKLPALHFIFLFLVTVEVAIIFFLQFLKNRTIYVLSATAERIISERFRNVETNSMWVDNRISNKTACKLYSVIESGCILSLLPKGLMLWPPLLIFLYNHDLVLAVAFLSRSPWALQFPSPALALTNTNSPPPSNISVTQSNENSL